MSPIGSKIPRTGSKGPQFFWAGRFGAWPGSTTPVEVWESLAFLPFFLEPLSAGVSGAVVPAGLVEVAALIAANKSLAYCVCPSVAPFSMGPMPS